MQIHWSARARAVYATCGPYLPHNASIHITRHYNIVTQTYPIFRKSAYPRPNSTSAHLVNPSKHASQIPLSNLDISSNLSPAQVSRAAAQAVRRSLRNTNLDDAFFIVTSMRNAYNKNRSFNNPTINNKLTRSSQSLFPSNVSPRMAAHTLLHGLIRAGLTKKAATLAQQIMKDGIPMRTLTLERLMSKLSPAPTSLELIKTPTVNIPLAPPQSDALVNVKPGHVRDFGTRSALKLFITAKKCRQRRSDGMYELLICACIINGEIIIGSLLLGFYIKESQVKQKLTCSNVDEEKQQMTKQERLSRQTILMHNILHPIKQALANADVDDVDNLTDQQRAALQALSSLAVLVEKQSLGLSALGPLFRALYMYPNGSAMVAIRRYSGGVTYVRAYSYFQTVLMAVIWRMKKDAFLGPQDIKYTPRLDIMAYNSLLHYALRHQLKPSLADVIIEHMTKHREPPLIPDKSTLNILMRSGTLLRKHEYFDAAWANISNTEAFALGKIVPQSASNPSKHTRVIKTLRSSDRNPQQADIYTLHAYLSHLIAIGQPKLAVEIISQIFPDFLGTASATFCDPAWVTSGIHLGPYFFTTVITALRKNGAEFLAIHLWNLAQKCESASQSQESDREPWYLSVHAYTAMIQLYHQRARRILRYASRQENVTLNMNRISSSLAVVQDRITELYRTFKLRQDEQRAALGNVNRSEIQPDARLFNAIIKPFAPRAPKTVDQCTKALELARKAYIHDGVLPAQWNPVLQEVSEDMAGYGYELPPGLKPIFVGRWSDQQLFNAPGYFHRRYKLGSHPSSTVLLPTRKTRGRPFRQGARRRHLY